MLHFSTETVPLCIRQPPKMSSAWGSESFLTASRRSKTFALSKYLELCGHILEILGWALRFVPSQLFISWHQSVSWSRLALQGTGLWRNWLSFYLLWASKELMADAILFSDLGAIAAVCSPQLTRSRLFSTGMPTGQPGSGNSSLILFPHYSRFCQVDKTNPQDVLSKQFLFCAIMNSF